jgi:hypothetical protein
MSLEKRMNGGEGGLSYEAITAITIGVAGFVMLMVVACAVNMRRKKGSEKVDAGDLDPEQQVYMREARNRNRDTLTGTKRFTMAAAANPLASQPSSYMARSGMSDYGYDDAYTPGWDSKPVSRRQSAYDHSPDPYHRAPNAADAEYFSHKVPHAQQQRQPLMEKAAEELSEKPGAHTTVVETESTSSTSEDQHHVVPKN